MDNLGHTGTLTPWFKVKYLNPTIWRGLKAEDIQIFCDLIPDVKKKYRHVPTQLKKSSGKIVINLPPLKSKRF